MEPPAGLQSMEGVVDLILLFIFSNFVEKRSANNVLITMKLTAIEDFDSIVTFSSSYTFKGKNDELKG